MTLEWHLEVQQRHNLLPYHFVLRTVEAGVYFQETVHVEDIGGVGGQPLATTEQVIDGHALVCCLHQLHKQNQHLAVSLIAPLHHCTSCTTPGIQRR
jgi:hypothetical protein